MVGHPLSSWHRAPSFMAHRWCLSDCTVWSASWQVTARLGPCAGKVLYAMNCVGSPTMGHLPGCQRLVAQPPCLPIPGTRLDTCIGSSPGWNEGRALPAIENACGQECLPGVSNAEAEVHAKGLIAAL